jgi:pyrimidine-nucleoside phosphorylase
MDAPLGRYVGNSLEVIESIETLKGNGPPELTELSVKLAVRMVELGGIASGADAERKVRTALSSGAGLEVFRKCIEEQCGDPKVIDDYSRLPQAPSMLPFALDHAGYITTLDAEKIGIAVRVLGGGRHRAEEGIDHAVGVIVRAKPGEYVVPDQPVFEVYYRDIAKMNAAMAILAEAYTVGDAPPAETPLILEEIA